MKTKGKDRHGGRSENKSAEGWSSKREQRGKEELTNREREPDAENDVQKTLSRGYFPDGPGGNYKGV